MSTSTFIGIKLKNLLGYEVQVRELTEKIDIKILNAILLQKLKEKLTLSNGYCPLFHFDYRNND
jgi:hypothetical protein